MSTARANLYRSQLLIEELRRLGLTYFVICPGSRSTPLVLALALDGRLTKIIHHDERGAAYHAIGHARATGRPAAVVTTSGTAAANLFPAVVEASMDHVPLIVLTADRPPELQDCGANQTINQERLFGDYSRSFVDFACPDDDDIDEAEALGRVDGAVASALGPKPGPVHFNCRYREPLAPPPDEAGPLDTVSLLVHPVLSGWAESESPLGHVARPLKELFGDEARELAETVRPARSGLLILGRLDTVEERQAALHLSKALGWPTVADITSGLALTDAPHLVHHHDLILRSESFRKDHRPDTVVHVGGRFVSKWLLEFLRESAPGHYLHNSAAGQPVDPAHGVTRFTTYDNVSFCSALARKFETNRTASPLIDVWLEVHREVCQALKQHVDDQDQLTEPVVARAVSAAQSAASAVFLASSMPIRDFDTQAVHNSGTVPVAANRGASGIDGTIASAAGYAIGLGQPTTLVIGDLAFLHDLSSLALVSELPFPLTIVVINNNGGRIFEQLPVAEHAGLIEPYFVAPHDLTFDKIADAFKIAYARADSRASFEKTYRAAVKSGGPFIIEAAVDPETNREHRRQVVEAVLGTVDRL